MKLQLVPLLVAAVVLGGAPAVRAQDKPKDSPYFPLKLNSTWDYKVGDTKLQVRVAKYEKVGDVMCALLETLNKEGKPVVTEHVAATDDGVYRYQALGQKVEPPLRILKLPPTKDDKWEVNSKAGQDTVKGTFTTSMEPEVKVPAGTYKDVVVVKSTDCMIGDKKAEFTTYFAKDVGMIKQMVKFGGRDFNIELEKYDAPKQP
jgi:hypothetical protein